jgi:hypothetical protein
VAEEVRHLHSPAILVRQQQGIGRNHVFQQQLRRERVDGREGRQELLVLGLLLQQKVAIEPRGRQGLVLPVAAKTAMQAGRL